MSSMSPTPTHPKPTNCRSPSQCVCDPDPQSTQQDEMWQGCWPFWHHCWDVESCWWGRSWAGKEKLVEAVFSCGMTQVDWEKGFILNLYKTVVTTMVSKSQIKSWSCRKFQNSKFFELHCGLLLTYDACQKKLICQILAKSVRLVCHGSFSILMTKCSSLTPRRSASASSRHERLAWKVKGSVLTRRKPSSWSPVLTWMPYRNQTSIHELSAARVSATTCSASYGPTRGAVVSLVDWWTSGTTSPQV